MSTWSPLPTMCASPSAERRVDGQRRVALGRRVGCGGADRAVLLDEDAVAGVLAPAGQPVEVQTRLAVGGPADDEAATRVAILGEAA